MSSILLLCQRLTEVKTELDIIHSNLEERISKNVRHVMLNRKDLDKFNVLITKLNHILENLHFFNDAINKVLHERGIMYGLIIACYNDYKKNNRTDAIRELENSMNQLSC